MPLPGLGVAAERQIEDQVLRVVERPRAVLLDHRFRDRVVRLGLGLERRRPGRNPPFRAEISKRVQQWRRWFILSCL